MYSGDFKMVQKGHPLPLGWTERWWWLCLPIRSLQHLRRQRDGTQISVLCPESIILYNKYMGGVDRGDQLRGYYSCRMKSRKFYKYIFNFMFDVAITNAYTLYKNYCSERTLKNVKEFRLQLAQQLIGEYCSRRRLGRRSAVSAPLPLRHLQWKWPM